MKKEERRRKKDYYFRKTKKIAMTIGGKVLANNKNG